MFVATAQAAPKKIQLEYEVKRDGELFANVVENFSQDGSQYKIESVTKGIAFMRFWASAN